MTAETDFSGVLRLLKQVPLPPEGETIRGADDAEIERLRHLPLPGEFVQWLRVCNGSVAGPGGLFGVEMVLAVSGFHPEWAGRGWIPVAGDGNGNTYVLDAGAVFFVDAMDDGELDYMVASDLKSFLESLLLNESKKLT
ncbi:SMI1/KNR4 family protein [Paractinoplanes lichenicola]|uniref:SMI1/KNR4 family protein n=1 Tax=Paractinoplanes lichenicola TaxID=2802976 RepID=A0ABS1VZK7_9ACTN|nr:SMI1/KNR4 family protein [Actinoplanes lichenicola]MBL7259931.1 SMI1/KNR4 family protein [Actinoplanes lichenicola]